MSISAQQWPYNIIMHGRFKTTSLMWEIYDNLLDVGNLGLPWFIYFGTEAMVKVIGLIMWNILFYLYEACGLKVKKKAWISMLNLQLNMFMSVSELYTSSQPEVCHHWFQKWFGANWLKIISGINDDRDLTQTLQMRDVHPASCMP